jgi:lipoate-protein ligase A
MHGEYKTPGGKLVVIDFEVVDGKIAHPSVSGDFFLEPPEALAEIDRALDQLPASAGEDEIAERIRTALEPGVAMIGFSPEAVARAVRRALS